MGAIDVSHRAANRSLSIIVCVKGEALAPADDGFGAGLPPTGAQTNHGFNEIKLGGGLSFTAPKQKK